MANIVNELKHFNGRSGLGAVMASKKLRAIAVRGHDRIEPKDKEELQACMKWFREHYDRNTDMLHKFGTSRNVMALSADGILPTRNFREGQFEYAKEISGQTMAETILTDEGTCYACAIACKRDVEVPGARGHREVRRARVRDDRLAGSVCGVGDLKAIAKFHQLCGEYVMDTISVGMTIAFAMECFETGILTTADTDGLDLRFGNAEAMLILTEKIGKREGFGDLLALGSERAAKRIGRGRRAVRPDGQEAGDSPCTSRGGSRGSPWPTPPRPPGRTTCAPRTIRPTKGFHPEGAHALEPLGLAEPLQAAGAQPAQGAGVPLRQPLVGPVQLRRGVPSGLGAGQRGRHHPDRERHARAVTGWDTSLWELIKVGERSKALARVFNCREGFTPKDDRLPKRLHEAFTSGPLQGVRVDPETVPAGASALPSDGRVGPRDRLADVRQAGRVGHRMGGQAGGHMVRRGGVGGGVTSRRHPCQVPGARGRLRRGWTVEEDLDRLFDHLNDRFFKGRLPKYRVHRCAPRIREHGFIDNEARTIWICNPSDLRKTLLHEMCHIGTSGHGRLFRAKLRRLARHGERWAQAERAYYLRVQLGVKVESWAALLEIARDLKGGFIGIVA